MEAAEVCLGSSTVLVTVMIVVKYKACLLVCRLIVGVRHDYSVGRSQAYRHDRSVGRSQAYRHDRLVGRSQAYWRDQYRNSRRSGTISLSMVCGSTVPASGSNSG